MNSNSYSINSNDSYSIPPRLAQLGFVDDAPHAQHLSAAPETESTIFETPHWLKWQKGSRKQNITSVMSKR